MATTLVIGSFWPEIVLVFRPKRKGKSSGLRAGVAQADDAASPSAGMEASQPLRERSTFTIVASSRCIVA
jgi:hypothetical protein